MLLVHWSESSQVPEHQPQHALRGERLSTSPVTSPTGLLRLVAATQPRSGQTCNGARLCPVPSGISRSTSERRAGLFPAHAHCGAEPLRLVATTQPRSGAWLRRALRAADLRVRNAA